MAVKTHGVLWVKTPCGLVLVTNVSEKCNAPFKEQKCRVQYTPCDVGNIHRNPAYLGVKVHRQTDGWLQAIVDDPACCIIHASRAL